MRNLLNRWLTRGAETTASVGLAAFFFVIFLGLLSVTFPEGTSLKSLMRTSAPRTLEPVARPGDAPVAMSDAGPVAILAAAHRKVKDKPPDDLAWADSRSGLELRDRHAVQTLANSGATIEFATGLSLTLDEQSLVVVKHRNPYRVRASRSAEVLLMGGQIRGTVDPASAGSGEVEIVTPASRMKATATTDESVNFGVTVNDDGSSTYSIFEGQVEVTDGERTLLVGPQESITTTDAERLSAPLPLPGRPELLAPATDEVRLYRAQPPRIEFQWKSRSEAERYGLVISRDAGFENVVHEAEVADTVFAHGNLKAGTYYWRVEAVRGTASGPPSVMGVLRVEKDPDPPGLEVAFPDTTVIGPELEVRGTTEPGCRVFVAGDEVRVDEGGAFEHALPLERGVNTVVVESVDEAGNTTYRSKFVRANY